MKAGALAQENQLLRLHKLASLQPIEIYAGGVSASGGHSTRHAGRIPLQLIPTGLLFISHSFIMLSISMNITTVESNARSQDIQQENEQAREEN